MACSSDAARGLHKCDNDQLSTTTGSTCHELDDSGLSAHVSSHEVAATTSLATQRILVLIVCIFGVVHWGMVEMFGVIEDDLDEHYGLTQKEGDNVYAWLNVGSCALSFIPGICYDRFGLVPSMVIGSLTGIAPVVLLLSWATTFPYWLGIKYGLAFCYMFFGLASSFFNVIGCLTPVIAFEEKHLGKVSAVVQVCLSLGITVQSAAYASIKAAGGEFIVHYFWYMLVFTAVVGALMCGVFRRCRILFQDFGAESDRNTFVCEKGPTLVQKLRSAEFWYLSFVFFVAIGFSFSYLSVVARIGDEAGVKSSTLSIMFGILNALGRIVASVPLDYTRHHRFGGIFTYMVAALFIFTCGLLCLAAPAAPRAHQVHLANAIVGLGYGALLGIVPPALRIIFGTKHLGILYGLLYIWVSVAVPLWGKAAIKAEDCHGVACYRKYCIGGVIGVGGSGVLGLAMLALYVRRWRASSVRPCLLEG